MLLKHNAYLKRGVIVALGALVLTLVALPANAREPNSSGPRLEMYTIAGPQDKVAKGTEGIELVNPQSSTSGVKADVVLTDSQRSKLAASGVKVEVKRNSKGQSVTEQAAAQAAAGYTVWRSWDQKGGIRDELKAVAKQNPQITKLVSLGKTHQGRDILALRVTKDASRTAEGARPSVLYSSNQHAREWISLETNRRLMNHFVNGWKANDPEIKNLLSTTELWFVLSANPDGYQYSFDHERLWRKNVRDNNGDGQITVGDGVDPNRNFDNHWGYDNEGSSPSPSDETYRGPSAASEPETKAMQGLIKKIKPKFQSNLHSYGEWLLYAQGWQTGTLDADNPIYVALGGTDANSAIPGFNPGQSADTLYVTNGETTDYADTSAGTIAYTPELGEGIPGAGFVFPDDEALIQAEFVKTLPFHMGLARSAVNPANPVSPVGITTKSFYLDQDEIDPQNGQQSLFDFKFAVSYGDPQEVRILAKRSLGAVTAKYQINGGRVKSAATSEWKGGARYGPGNGTYYHVVSGKVTGTKPTDQVKVWFEGDGQTSESFTYTAQVESSARTLILSAEDYTGASPTQPGVVKPQYLSVYQDALKKNKIAFDVYDVDAQGRVAPDNLGVLSHYDAVVWYTGKDIVTREPGWGGGNASRLAMQELYEVRDFINEGGRVSYDGQFAGQQYTPALGLQLYDPFENKQCSSDPAITARCLPLLGSGNSQGDPIEYFFGAAITTPDGGTDPQTGNTFNVSGLRRPLTGLSWAVNGPNAGSNSSFVATTDLLKVSDPTGSFPQFESKPAAEYLSGIAGPFDPHTGQSFMWANMADAGYKRLTRTVTVPVGGGNVSFWSSYNLEQAFDYLVVEAHTAGQNDWTTLPDLNGHTSSDLSGDRSCPGGWSNPADAANVIHPFLANYQTFDPNTGTCSNTGTTGSWNAANGSSSGWQQLKFDLAPYAGKQVELSITVLSDWGFQQFPGVFIDDIVVSTGEGSTSFEDGADPTNGWTVSGAPQDAQGIEGANVNDWTRRGGLGVKEGAVITTPNTVYMGFGFQDINGATNQKQIMGRIMAYLLR